MSGPITQIEFGRLSLAPFLVDARRSVLNAVNQRWGRSTPIPPHTHAVFSGLRPRRGQKEKA
jgi:hypothetical protein